MRTNIRMRHSFLLAAIIALPAYAELNDGPYFNLWLGTAGNQEVGQGDYLVMCGRSGGCNGDTNIAGGLGAGYAIFRTSTPNSGAGSGNIDPFLRFQHNEGDPTGSATTEAAFNTDYNGGPKGFEVGTIYNAGTVANAFDTNGGVKVANQAKDVDAGKDFNQAIKLSDLMVDEDGFYTFRLDVNEPGGTKSNILLDELQLFVASSNTLNQYELDQADSSKTGEPISGTLNGATKVWDMDFNKLVGGVSDNDNGTTVAADNKPGDRLGGIMLDSVKSSGPSNGSGDFDMEFLVHETLFDGYSPDSYVYLYNFMGQADPDCKPNDPDCDGEASAGFEEWAAEVTTSPTPPGGGGGGGGVPEPSTAFLMAAGIAGLFRVNRFKGSVRADGNNG